MCSVYNNILFHIIALITVQNIESKVLLAKDRRDTVVKQFIYLFLSYQWQQGMSPCLIFFLHFQ